jgi:hypothetical protein
MTNLTGVFKQAQKLVFDNSPLILTAVGVAGTITTAVFTGRASLKAARLLDANSDRELTTREKVELTWTLYIPAVATGVITVASIITSNRVGTRRAAAMAAAYSLSEKAFSEYKEKIVERMGTAKEQAVRDEIAQDRIDRSPSKEIIIIGTGKVLCHDAITGRYFESDMEALRKAQNDLNVVILNNQYATLHEFYKLLGLPATKYSSEVGWNSSELCDLRFSTVMSEDGRPCISIDYSPFPIRDYY